MMHNNIEKDIDILVNNPYVQAVKHKGLGIIQAVFYKGGEINVGNNLVLSSDNPGIIMIKMEGEKINEISVSDPNRELKRFNLFVNSKIEKSGEYCHVVWNNLKRGSHISIKLPDGNYAGDSVTIPF